VKERKIHCDTDFSGTAYLVYGWNSTCLAYTGEEVAKNPHTHPARNKPEDYIYLSLSALILSHLAVGLGKVPSELSCID